MPDSLSIQLIMLVRWVLKRNWFFLAYPGEAPLEVFRTDARAYSIDDYQIYAELRSAGPAYEYPHGIRWRRLQSILRAFDTFMRTPASLCPDQGVEAFFQRVLLLACKSRRTPQLA